MSLPLGLSPDSKRNINFCFLRKNQNSTMLDKGGISVSLTSDGCTANPMNQRESKLQAFLSPPSAPFPHREKFMSSINSILVGGFLGSKSQLRSTGNTQMFWEFNLTEILPNLIGAATECMKKHCDFSSAPSPPKKKFAQEVGLGNLTIVNTTDFPSVTVGESHESSAEGPRQSYAEVAKAPSFKPDRSESCRSSRNLTDSSVQRKGSSSRRRSADHKSSRRRGNRRVRRENLPSTASGGDSVQSTGLEPRPEPWKDLRLNQQEKHYNHRKNSSNRNFRRADRLDHQPKENSLESSNCTKRQSHYRSHCDNKRGTRARKYNCDIDKINWRTGEPISRKMGSQYVRDAEGVNFVTELPLDNNCENEQSDNDYPGEPRKHEEPTPTAEASWPDSGTGSPRCRRRRLSSECSVDSEDSFIVFQSGVPSDDSLSEISSEYSDCDSDDSYESDSGSLDEDDEYNSFIPSSTRLQEVNDLWQREYQCGAGSSSDETKHNNNKTNEADKKVRFSNSKPVIHRMLTWDFAYRSSRPGPWEEMARDRERFKNRIRQFDCILSPFLKSDHRNKIWQRFHTQQL